MEIIPHVNLYASVEHITIQTFLSNREDFRECFRFFEGMLSATLISILLWVAILWVILPSP